MKDVIREARKFANNFRVSDGKKFRLDDFDPGETLGLGSEDRPRAKEALATGVAALAELQGMLYAQDRWSVLLIFQAMDAAGKDGAIKHVMSGINPQGCQVFSFKAPTSEDLDHDFMWRCLKCLPERGRIGIFNRAITALVVRVHSELLKKSKVPPELVTKNIWRNLSGHPGHRALSEPEWGPGSQVLSQPVEEGTETAVPGALTFRKELEVSPSDVKERGYWNDYMKAYRT
jgi:polyphosphate kinase 2 (PPK2 family)